MAVNSYLWYVNNYYGTSIALFSRAVSNWNIQLSQVNDTALGSNTFSTQYLYDSYGNIATEYHYGGQATSIVNRQLRPVIILYGGLLTTIRVLPISWINPLMKEPMLVYPAIADRLIFKKKVTIIMMAITLH